MLNDKSDLPVIGWREWVALPDLGVPRIKVKVDTGARSSSLHAHKLEQFERDGAEWVKFEIHPVQRTSVDAIRVESRVIDVRDVRSSNGKRSRRPVIRTSIGLMDRRWDVELTLANRDEMGFRMLLGREAFRERFLVDAGRSFLGGRPARPKKSRTKKSGAKKLAKKREQEKPGQTSKSVRPAPDRRPERR